MIKGRLVIFLLFITLSVSSSNIDSLVYLLDKQEGREKMNTLINLYESYKNSEPYKAIETIKEAIQIAENSENANIKCTVYNKLGNVYTDLGLNFPALDAYYSALKYSKESTDPVAYPYSLIDVGNVYYAIGNNSMAIEYYKNSIEIFERQKDVLGLAVANNNIGLVNINMKKYQEALDYFLKAYKYRQELGGIDVLAHSNLHISDAYLNLKQYEKAIEHLRIADELYEKANNFRSKAIVASRLGDIYMAEKKYPIALQSFLRASQLFKQQNIYIWIVRSNLSLAKVYIMLNNNLLAATYAEEALKKSKENNFSQYLSELMEILANIYYSTGQVDKAYKYRQQQNIVTDSLRRANENQQFTNLQFSVETFKNRLERERLNNEIQKRNTQRNYLIVIMALIISVFVLVISRYKLKQKQEHLEHIRQEELAAFEIRHREDENDSLHRELELRERELTSKSMGGVKNEEFISDIVKELQDLDVKKENREKVQYIIDRLKHNLKEDSWEEFEMRFAKVHQNFNTKLAELYPDLTPNERRLCAFLRLNMTTKEISSITYQSSKSIDVARSRLRKKMKMPREENLICYLANF